MMVQEVRKKNLTKTEPSIYANEVQLQEAKSCVLFFFFFILADLCVEDGVHDTQREDTLQNISADDLPDSASQTAQQHDTKFSFRS